MTLRVLFEKALDFLGYQMIIHKKISLTGENAGSKFDRRYLEKIVRKLKAWSVQSPKTLVEIGANLGQDSAYLSKVWGIPPQNVYCLEPIKEFVDIIRRSYGFKTFDIAAFNINGDSEFNSGYIDASSMRNAGSSSLLNSLSSFRSKKILIKTVRMDTWMRENNVKEIDFLKIDAEGVSYEIIEGFGTMIDKVKIIQVETERIQWWRNQKNEKFTFTLLESLGFELADYVLDNPPTHADSLWIKKGLLS